MKPITRNITNVNRTIGNSTANKKYIVVHYVGAVSTAKNNGIYFKNVYRGVSAGYFVDENDVVQVVEDKDIGWHCGTSGAYKHPYARNSNSIGVEMCVKKDRSGNWYFEPATVENTQELVASLIKKYNIPISNLLRHYDITGKNCPEPYIRSKAAWDSFIAGIEKQLAIPVPPPTIKVASKVKITGNNYATGQAIPGWVKNSTHTVSKISGVSALLGSPSGINSWVRLAELKIWTLSQPSSRVF